MEPYEILHRALVFAERAHRGQLRKGTNDPYFDHPVAVAMLVLAHGYGMTAATIGVLHDVIEDTPADRDEIEDSFGSEIATAVVDLTEQDKIHPWEQRKIAYVRHLSVASEIALPVCAADKIHNLSSTLWDLADARVEGRGAEAVWDRFKRPPEKIAAYHRAVERALTARGLDGPLRVELNRAIEKFARFVGADPLQDLLG